MSLRGGRSGPHRAAYVTGASADDVPEQVISHAFARGEPWALEATYERWSALVYTFALRMLRDGEDAQDVTQEVFLSAWRGRGGYRPEQRLFLSWAAVWQAKVRTEMLLRRMATDPHSPAEFRCNQIVRNLPPFYTAFDVEDSDALWLDENQRVKIW